MVGGCLKLNIAQLQGSQKNNDDFRRWDNGKQVYQTEDQHQELNQVRTGIFGQCPSYYTMVPVFHRGTGLLRGTKCCVPGQYVYDETHDKWVAIVLEPH